MGKSPLIRSIAIGLLLGIALYGIARPEATNADYEGAISVTKSSNPNGNSRLRFCRLDKSTSEVVKTIKMVLTAYSSTPDQTDDTPFITASGKYVEDGIVANNMLPFGTKIRIPELYGDKIFTVEDRMHKRKGIYQADIWFSEYQEAKDFGAKIANIQILDI